MQIKSDITNISGRTNSANVSSIFSVLSLSVRSRVMHVLFALIYCAAAAAFLPKLHKLSHHTSCTKHVHISHQSHAPAAGISLGTMVAAAGAAAGAV